VWDTGWLRVIEGHVRGRTKLPKGKKGRITPMPDIVKVALLDHLETTAFNKPNDLVLARPVDGSELNASALNERFKEVVVESGIRPTELRRYKEADRRVRDARLRRVELPRLPPRMGLMVSVQWPGARRTSRSQETERPSEDEEPSTAGRVGRSADSPAPGAALFGWSEVAGQRSG